MKVSRLTGDSNQLEGPGSDSESDSGSQENFPLRLQNGGKLSYFVIPNSKQKMHQKLLISM